MIRRPPRSTQSRSSAASDVYKRQLVGPVDQARVDGRSRSADLATEQVGQLAEKGELVGAGDSGAAGHDDRSVLELDGGLANLAAQDLEDEISGLERGHDMLDH